MKILHTADWHIGRTIRGRSRHQEQVAVLDEIVELARLESVDLVLIAGDQFDLASPSPAAEALVYRTLLGLAEVAPVVMVAGNHDHPQRLEAVAPLLRLGRVTVGSVVARPDEGGVVAPLPGVRVALIPFLSQRAIVSADDLMALDADQHGGKYAGRVQAIVEALCAEMTSDEVNLLVAHMMVSGGSPGGGERAAHTVFDYSVPAQIFPTHLSYVALGHLHRHQQLPATPPVWYSGSPIQLDFGEVDDIKGAVIVEAEAGIPARCRFHRLEAGYRLRVVRGSLAEVEAAADELTDRDYVRVVLDEPTRVGLADAVRQFMPQAVEVTLDPARRTHVAVGASRHGRTPQELFVEYLKEGDAFDERVVRLFDDLVEEAHEA